MKNDFLNRAPTRRRRFLGLLTAASAGLLAAPSLLAQSRSGASSPAVVPTKKFPLVDSPPVLQCPTETSIVVVWAVGRSAAGFVEYGAEKDHLDKKAFGAKFGLNAVHERFLQIRINDLQPGTRYYYRTVTCSVDFVSAYYVKQSSPHRSEVFSFETPSPRRASASFAVINDTHNNQISLKRITARLARIGADHTVWNGDLVDSFEDADTAVEAVLRPANAPFAAEKPMLFVPGNHDYRGVWARNSLLVLPEWEHPAPEDRLFGRNFVLRNGPLALIGLDTGEDRPDARSEWGGLVSFEPYRVAQRNWLERALKSPAVATAPFVVAFAHIPLYSPNPNANGGDLMQGWAAFHRQAADLWGPLLTQHGVQCLIAAHQHRFAYFPATSERSWAQIQGGGPSPTGKVTVIHGKASGNTMEIAVDELNKNVSLGRWTFPKRKHL